VESSIKVIAKKTTEASLPKPSSTQQPVRPTSQKSSTINFDLDTSPPHNEYIKSAELLVQVSQTPKSLSRVNNKPTPSKLAALHQQLMVLNESPRLAACTQYQDVEMECEISSNGGRLKSRFESISRTLNLDDSDSEQDKPSSSSTSTHKASDDEINHLFSRKQARVIFFHKIFLCCVETPVYFYLVITFKNFFFVYRITY
jgi:hypothetical protein